VFFFPDKEQQKDMPDDKEQEQGDKLNTTRRYPKKNSENDNESEQGMTQTNTNTTRMTTKR
jgi:hypothetical protein